MKNARPLAVLALAALAVAAVGASRVATDQNPSVKLFSGTISSYAKLDAGENVLETGIVVPMNVVDNAPRTMDMKAPLKVDAVLEFPEVVRQTTFLDHTGIFWNPKGHDPALRYGVPHWDFHFFTIKSEDAARINCADLGLEKSAQVAPGWLPTVLPGAPAKDNCVPLMGFHSLPATEFKAPGVLQDGEFEKVMLGGYCGGKFTFLEPMLA